MLIIERGDANLEKMAKVRPAFKEGGTVTAANACGMPDGAAAYVLMPRDKARSLGLEPLFSIVSYSNAAVDNAYMGCHLWFINDRSVVFGGYHDYR